MILDWDCALRADSAAAALYELWMVEWRQALLRRAVPETVQPLMSMWLASEIADQLSGSQSPVFGEHPAIARDELLRDTLQTAFQKLSTLQGPDAQHWSWGAMHRAYFRHPLDAGPGLAPLLDRGPVERSGDGEVVQATSFEDGSFDQTSGASYREVFDLSDWDQAVAINVPGQSGQPGSKHYDDLLPLWAAGRYFPLRYSKAAIDSATTDVLVLRP